MPQPLNNAIEALIQSRLEDGNLWNEEGRFLDVLRMAGIDDVQYFDSDANHEGVYDTYLKIRNPFDTSEMYTEEFVDGLEAWLAQQDQSKYKKESMGADFWDKNNTTVEEWIEHARYEIPENATNNWTRIPDAVTDYLKSLGHDGIKDQGGKGGGEGHTVWIPFTGEQVKDSAPVTFDDAGNVIPIGERFDQGQKDIRHQARDNNAPQFEYMKPFAEQVKDFVKAKVKDQVTNKVDWFTTKANRRQIFGNDALLVGKTPKVLQDIGMPVIPITITQAHVGFSLDGTYYNQKHPEYTDDHIIDPVEFGKLYEKLSDPIAIISHPIENNKLIVLIEMKNDGGKQNIIPLTIDGEGIIGGVGNDTYHLLTVHGNKDAISMLNYAIKNENDSDADVKLYYVNNKKTQQAIMSGSTIQAAGMKLDGSIHNITDAGSNVKLKVKKQTDTRQFRNWFGDSVMTEDGKPKGKPIRFYHGTNYYEPISVFKSGKKGILGPGIYLTNRKSRAEWYANQNGGNGTVYEVYLSVQNPLTLENEQNPARAILREVYGSDTVYNRRSAKAAWDTEIITKADIKKLQDMGYDGIVSDTSHGNYHEKEVMVFEPTQIKSATDNIGLFDPKNPDIHYSSRDQDYKTNRQLLAEALTSVAANESERQTLERYQLMTSQLDLSERRIEQINERIRELRLEER